MVSTSLQLPSAHAIRLAEKIQSDLGSTSDRWYVPTGRPGFALPILDSIYSTGNHYTGVKRLVSRYSKLRAEEGADASVDGALELADAISRWGGVEGFVERTGRRSRTYASRKAPYKAEAALQAAYVLCRHGIDSVDIARHTLRNRETRETSPIAKDWLAIPSQSSGLTWNYFLMLIGLPGVKADRMIRRYVTTALDSESLVSAKDASRLVEAVADSLGVNYTALDHTIWRYQSGREYLRPSEQAG